MEKTYKSKNGVTVYTYENSALHGFHLSLFFKAGLIYENKNEYGITHFFEHAAIRNVNRQMGGTLYRELDRRAVEFNASTYSEMCQFYTGGATESFEFSASLICKLFSPITLSAAEILSERKRIKAEIRESDEKSSVSTLSQEAVHEGTSLSSSILGSVKTVDQINKKRLNLYREKISARENLFFYLAGSFTESDVSFLLCEIEKYELKSAPARDNLAPVSKYFFNRQNSEKRLVIKNSESTLVRFTFDIDMQKVSMKESDLLYDALFNGYSSPFFIKMSEEEGLFYDISSSSERYKNIGTMSLSFEVKEKELMRSLKMALSIFSDFKKTLLSEKDMMKAAYVKNSGLLLDDARELAFTFAYDNHIMDEKNDSVSSRADGYNAVTPEALRDCAREIFNKNNLTLTVKSNKKKTSREEILSLIETYL